MFKLILHASKGMGVYPGFVSRTTLGIESFKTSSRISQGPLRRRRSSENFITFLETCEKTYLECEYISFYSVVATHAQWIANYVH